MANSISKGKNEVGGLPLPNFKSYKAAVTKTVGDGQENKQK